MENEDTTQNVAVKPPVTENVIPSAVGDIHVPSSKIPFDMNFSFNPTAPTTIESNDTSQGYGVSTTEKGIGEATPGFIKTAGAEAYEFNATAEGLHAGYEDYKKTEPQLFNNHLKEHPDTSLMGLMNEKPNPLMENVPTGWTPNAQTEMFYDIKPEYMSYLMDSRGPKDLQYRRDRVLSEQDHDDTLANGSMFARIIGGIGGVISDPVSYIPVAGWVKYAKLAPTFLKSAARALPGVAATGVIQSGAKQLDRVNGNLQDFVIDAAINTVFGATIFGGLGVAASSLDKMELWGLRDLAKSTIKGVDFNFELGEKGEIKGIKAFDTTGDLSAAEVSHAQEMANSSFNKSGFFKIPYVGDATLKLKSLPGIGSPLLNMLNSPYQTVRAFVDRAADHTVLTKGVAEGGTKPKSFEFFMKKQYASLRSISAQMNALHLQRMGVDLKIRPVGDVTRIGLGLYNKSLKLLGKDLDETGYVPREQFNDEVQRVLINKEPSEHAAVNDAASIMREKMDTTYKEYLKAYNLPEDILDPKTAAGYLMRVYDTPYMNVNKDKWVSTISNWLKESDTLIADRMEPINTLSKTIKDFEEKNTQAVHILANLEAPKIAQPSELGRIEKGITITHGEEKAALAKHTTELQKGSPEYTLQSMRKKLKLLKEGLQNELRENPELRLHVHDLHALSAKEAQQLKSLLKPTKDLEEQVDEQKIVVSQAKKEASKKLSAAKKTPTVEKAIPKSKKFVEAKNEVMPEEEKLKELQDKLDLERDRLQELAHTGQVNPRLFRQSKDSFNYEFKDPNDRLRFRDVYESHTHRESHAKAYYDTIMHQNPEDTISDVMGKITGNSKENHLKSRTLLVPDELLYNNNFMTKDLMAKLSNYVTYLSRRTNLKNVFKDVTIDGGIEPLIEKLNLEFKSKKEALENKKESLKDKDEIKKIDKEINSETKRFDDAKNQMNKSYEKMMGINQRSRGLNRFRSAVMSMTAMTNLHFLPATQIADLGSIGLQHGVWPFVRDAVYPVVESLGGILKTKDSEALRKSAPSVHLALQDVLSGYADKNWGMESQPYLNLGRWVGGIEKMAHFSSNTDLTTYIDNGLQRLAGATVQSEFMRILHDAADGSMSKKDSEYLRKYGIDPKKWADRMVKAYKDSNGYKTKLGGYQSNFWEWQDFEAANEFSDAVFRGIQNTILNRGMFDSPFWADNMMGMIFHTFTGWGYASINRYLVPMLQRPDAEKMLGVVLSLGFGSLVSPLRRAIRGEDAYPDNMDDAHRFWESINDSNVASAIANTLDWANLLSGDRLLGDLKNDKYRDRMMIGGGGAVAGTANRIQNIFSALASGQFNEKDALQMARMLPLTGSVWGYYLSKILIDKLGLPPNRRAAAAG